ncbi:MAG: hypothetical protein JWO76_908 [Nocardioides sp.]|nr:hypothetical protein [Nocardioides sp.]
MSSRGGLASIAAAVALCVGTACSGGSPDPAAATSSHEAVPSPTNTTSSVVVRMREVHRVVFAVPRGRRVDHPAPAANGVAYVLSPPNRPTWTEVRWGDYATGRSHRVAHPRHGWFVDNLSAGRGWVAWVEQDHLPEDPAAPVAWRIKAYDVSTGRTTTLLESGAEEKPLAPGVLVSGRTVFSSVYRGLEDATTDFFAFALPSGRKRVVATDVAGGQLAYDGHHLITTITESRGNGPGESTNDLYVLHRHHVEPVTDDDRSVDPMVSDGRLAWISGNSVYTRPWPADGEPTLVTRHSDPLPSLGRGFVSDMVPHNGSYAARVIALDDPTRAFLLRRPPGTRLVGLVRSSGRHVAWPVASHADPRARSKLVVSTIRVTARQE